MIWGGDFDSEDYGLEPGGVVANLSCPNCNAYAEFYSGVPEKQGKAEGGKK